MIINDVLGVALFVFIVTMTYSIIALMAKTLSGKTPNQTFMDECESDPLVFSSHEEVPQITRNETDPLHLFVKKRRLRTR